MVIAQPDRLGRCWTSDVQRVSFEVSRCRPGHLVFHPMSEARKMHQDIRVYRVSIGLGCDVDKGNGVETNSDYITPVHLIGTLSTTLIGDLLLFST